LVRKAVGFLLEQKIKNLATNNLKIN